MGSCVIFPAGKKVRVARWRKDGTRAKVIAFRPRAGSGDGYPLDRSARSPIETLRAWLRWLKPMKPRAHAPRRLAR